MYCPRCGRQPITDELRFCSYCGFKLGVVKASLADSEEVASTASAEARTLLRLPRNRDIGMGVILMFAGAVFATGIGRMEGREAGALTLAIFYLATLLFSGPVTKGIFKLFSRDEPEANVSTGRKGLCFGASLMFITTIALTLASQQFVGRMRSEPFFVGLALSFALLLVIGRFLMRGLQYLVTEETTVSFPRSTESPEQVGEPGFSGLALQAGHDDPVPIFSSQRVQTAEIVSPGSITEHTTNLLDKK